MPKPVLWTYAVTWGHAGIIAGGVFHSLPSAPKKPTGLGWEMCGMSACDGILYWAWRRPGLQQRAARKKRKARSV